MLRAARYKALLDYFQEAHPVVETELAYTNPFELIVAVALSAQCTDKRVNMVTPSIFERFPDAYALANASFDEVFGLIKSISYPNNKAKHLIAMSQLLVGNFKGEVPSTMDELITLPGVGRKTANVILSVVYNQPAMAVDTHVFRVSKRLGLVNQNLTTPLAVEKTLMKYLPKAFVPRAHHWLILHGRYVCLARQPKCLDCALTQWCKYYEKHLAIEKE
jgi:endonuclease III